jgi:hypothetical protein
MGYKNWVGLVLAEVRKRWKTYNGQGLDAEHERVRGQVARVGEGVFLPELGKEGLGRGNGGMAQDEVAFFYLKLVLHWFMRKV